VLGDLRVTPERILATSCMQAGAGELAPDARLQLMPRLKQALEHGRRIADGSGVRLADTEHLLAGVVAVEDSMAVEILRRLRVGVTDVRAELAARLGVEPERLGAPSRRRRRLRSRLTLL
jgi:ATP-dependent Clp protease ATP-binding subunit ClpA